MSKITSKIKFLDENRLSFKIEDGMLSVQDQYENEVGNLPLPIPIDTDNMDADAIYQKAEECGYNIDDMISDIIQTSVIEKHEYDVWLSQEVFIFFSPTKNEWTSEPYSGIFATLKDMYEEEMKEYEAGADNVETESLDCPIEGNDDSLVSEPKKDPNFDYGDEDDEEEEDIDYVSQILNKNDSKSEDIEDDIVEEDNEIEDVIEENVEVDYLDETPKITEEPVVEKEVVPEIKKEIPKNKSEQPKVEPKKENKQQQQNNNQQKQNKPEQPKVEPKKENKVSQNNNQKNNQNEQKNTSHPNENKKEKNVMSQPNNKPENNTASKSFAWNDKAKTLRAAVDEVIKHKNETKSNEITDLAKNVVSLIEEKHIDPNNADEKEILYTLALDGKTIIKGLSPIRAGIYKAMLMKELRSLGF